MSRQVKECAELFPHQHDGLMSIDVEVFILLFGYVGCH